MGYERAPSRVAKYVPEVSYCQAKGHVSMSETSNLLTAVRKGESRLLHIMPLSACCGT